MRSFFNVQKSEAAFNCQIAKVLSSWLSQNVLNKK